MLRGLVELGPRAHAVLEDVLDQVPVHELAAMAFDWEGTWARPEQVIPQGKWRSCGFLTGRGFGKTRSVVSFMIGEVAAGRAMRVALIGQSEAKSVEVLVEGETGILALCPPWLGAEWFSSSNRVIFGNGATASVYTPQEASGLRGPQHHLGVATEIASWPKATRAEAMSNLRLGLRLGYGKLLWESTPKRRNPLIREMLDRAKRDPTRHLLVTGRTDNNTINLAPGVVEEWKEMWGGTSLGAEELDGTFFDDAEDALFRQAWIDKARRSWPSLLVRRVITVDPAITSNPKYSDATGIADMGLGVDRQVYVLGNMTGVHRAEVWPGTVVEAYVKGGCDLIVIETNRGGNAWAALIRGACHARGLTLEVIGAIEVPGHRAGVVYLREINSKTQKVVRAGAAAALVERGRVSFVGDQLGALEDRLCAFDGTEGAPDDEVDAFVLGCHELAGLAIDRLDPRVAFAGIKEMSAALNAAPRGAAVNLAALLGGGNGGGRI